LGCLLALAICQFGSGSFVLVTALVATVGDLARWAMIHQEAPAQHQTAKRWTPELVSARVREVVIEQLDCAAAYHEDARFVEDLGMA
jgi:hypothetical protein